MMVQWNLDLARRFGELMCWRSRHLRPLQFAEKLRYRRMPRAGFVADDNCPQNSVCLSRRGKIITRSEAVWDSDLHNAVAGGRVHCSAASPLFFLAGLAYSRWPRHRPGDHYPPPQQSHQPPVTACTQASDCFALQGR